MGFPNSIAAYPDVEALFEKALATERGLRLSFKSAKEATFQAGRFNAYRVRLRRENKRVYPADHALHTSTPYDCLMVRKNGTEVIIEKMVVERFEVEEIVSQSPVPSGPSSE